MLTLQIEQGVHAQRQTSLTTSLRPLPSWQEQLHWYSFRTWLITRTSTHQITPFPNFCKKEKERLFGRSFSFGGGGGSEPSSMKMSLASLQAYSDFCFRTTNYKPDKTLVAQSSSLNPTLSNCGTAIRQIKRSFYLCRITQ